MVMRHLSNALMLIADRNPDALRVLRRIADQLGRDHIEADSARKPQRRLGGAPPHDCCHHGH